MFVGKARARGKHSSLLRKSVNYGRKKFYNTGPWGLNYKTLRISNLRENVRFRNKLMTLARANIFLFEQTNTIAYYGVRRLRIRNFFIVQAPGALKAMIPFH
jgi:hypothetical protein